MRGLKIMWAVFVGVVVTTGQSLAAPITVMIGDNDGYGAGIAADGTHTFNPTVSIWDGRSAAEVAASDGAQFTDTFSTTHTGFSPQKETVATFQFTGLGGGWTDAFLDVDMADFQASQFGATKVTYNGIVQNWAFNDGAGNTRNRTFNLAGPVLDSINVTGALIVAVDRNNSIDFYGFDFLQLRGNRTDRVPEPASLVMTGLGLAAFGAMRRRASSRRPQ